TGAAVEQVGDDLVAGLAGQPQPVVDDLQVAWPGTGVELVDPGERVAVEPEHPDGVTAAVGDQHLHTVLLGPVQADAGRMDPVLAAPVRPVRGVDQRDLPVAVTVPTPQPQLRGQLTGHHHVVSGEHQVAWTGPARQYHRIAGPA